MKALAGLCDTVMTFNTNKERLLGLKSELCKLNQQLPAAVYLPFVNSSMRNYAILNICVDEAIVFKTKERAPILLTFEAFRPAEMSID